METSRRLVLKTLNFDKPQRIPRHLWLLPWAEINYPNELSAIQKKFQDDIIISPTCLKNQPQKFGDPYKKGVYIDEWGCEFINHQDGVIGEVKKPQINDWQNTPNIRLPKELLTINIQKINAFCADTDKFVLSGSTVRPFERIQFIRGTENTMMDLALEESKFIELLKEIHNFYLEELQLWCHTNVDGICFMDDWGSQRALLISPAMWRKIFKPLYKDYIELGHKFGKKVFMHSDGFILDIIPDLIELGLDAINSQIFCMGIKSLKKFKGKITFWGEIDRQYLLSNGTTQQIRDAVKMVHDSLYQNGGIIAQLEFGAGAKAENVFTAFETWETLSK